MPIIALGLDELAGRRIRIRLLALLRRNTGTVLYPVQSGERVRDSFLMIKRGDEWLAGGYANTTVTRRLVEQRRPARRDLAERAEHYLLSVAGAGRILPGSRTGADATPDPGHR